MYHTVFSVSCGWALLAGLCALPPRVIAEPELTPAEVMALPRDEAIRRGRPYWLAQSLETERKSTMAKPGVLNAFLATLERKLYNARGSSEDKKAYETFIRYNLDEFLGNRTFDITAFKLYEIIMRESRLGERTMGDVATRVLDYCLASSKFDANYREFVLEKLIRLPPDKRDDFLDDVIKGYPKKFPFIKDPVDAVAVLLRMLHSEAKISEDAKNIVQPWERAAHGTEIARLYIDHLTSMEPAEKAVKALLTAMDPKFLHGKLEEEASLAILRVIRRNRGNAEVERIARTSHEIAYLLDTSWGNSACADSVAGLLRARRAQGPWVSAE